MSGLEIAGLALAIVPVVVEILTSAGATYRRARFGLTWGTLLYAGRVISTDTLQQRHWEINTWADAELESVPSRIM